jgi:4-phytase / acid phosphatase
MLTRFISVTVTALVALPVGSLASPPQVRKSDHAGEKLKFVVYLSRHGVRSPTGKTAQYNQYSAAPWPEWDVPPGHLTTHGYHLMALFGAYDRSSLAAQGLLAPDGCGDAQHITILADSDQRTRESAKALAEGLLPDCGIEVHALPEGTPDPVFHFLETGNVRPDHALAEAAILGRIGGDAGNLTEAWRAQLTALDQVLAGCGHSSTASHDRTSLFAIPANIGHGKDDQPAELRGPLSTASTLSENLLLEYTEGMPLANVGWGCVDGQSLRYLMQLHTAAAEFSRRTPAIARMQSSNLLEQILKAIEQQSTGKAIAGAPGRPGDRMLLLVGHDTNIAAVAGTLGLNWIIDGRADDTPPGGALVFEMWQSRETGDYSVRISYTAQTLEQMRDDVPLTLDNPPARVPVFLPSCSRQDSSCSFESFAAAMRQAINPTYVMK